MYYYSLLRWRYNLIMLGLIFFVIVTHLTEIACILFGLLLFVILYIRQLNKDSNNLELQTARIEEIKRLLSNQLNKSILFVTLNKENDTTYSGKIIIDNNSYSLQISNINWKLGKVELEAKCIWQYIYSKN